MSVLILSVDELSLAPIADYASHGAASIEWAHGAGPVHVHTIRFAPGGAIGPHPTGSGQLFVPLAGEGWVSGPGGERQPLQVGQVAIFACGELHAKGSDTGLVALMVQVADLEAMLGMCHDRE